MMSDTYFTIPFKMGQVVVNVRADGSVTSIDFDLEGIYNEKSTASKLGTEMGRYFDGHEVMWKLELDLTGNGL